MGISALRQYHAASAASAPQPDPDFRELYKAAQREIDVLRTENGELRAQLAPPVVVPETTPPEPETVDELSAAKPRARR